MFYTYVSGTNRVRITFAFKVKAIRLFCLHVPTCKAPKQQSSAAAVRQSTHSPVLTEASEIRDKQYFIFHSDGDYEPGKSKHKKVNGFFWL